MEKKVQISMLLQIYGKMLTEKQAVREVIKKRENKLFELEEKLSFMDRMLKQDKKIQQILGELCKIQEGSSDKKIEKILNNVTKELILMRI